MDVRDLITKNVTKSGLGLGIGPGRGTAARRGSRAFAPEDGEGRGRLQGNKAGAGPAGNCVCSSCGIEVKHSVGVPCYDRKCPKCGGKLERK